MTWAPGATVVEQGLYWGQIVTARPVTVVEDRPDLLALYSHPSTMFMSGATENRRSIDIDELMDIYDPARPITLTERQQRHYHCITLNVPDARRSVFVLWGPDWDWYRWYVNIQEPFRRTPIGIQVCDLTLDLWVHPDFTWEWKDAEELDGFVSRGYMTAERAELIRREALRAIADVEARNAPFGDPWPEWRPSSEWTVPSLPPGWDHVDWDELPEHWLDPKTMPAAEIGWF
jgi:hypothetical protein